MSKKIIHILVFLAVLPLVDSCLSQSGNHDQEYEPIDLFAPAYQALGGSGQGADDYNLDATIRVIRSLETASSKTGDFDEYMYYLACQDYRYVAPDVLEAQRKMFPVLQKMYLLQKENEKFDHIWSVIESTDEALLEKGNELLSSPDLLSHLSPSISSLVGLVSEGFEAYEKANKIKKANQAALEKVKSEYIASLQENWPVFLRYKEEWEKLCLKKDQSYLDVYDGRNISAYNIACDILQSYPDDRDALLIKAMALVGRDDFGYEQKIEAEQTLDTYNNLYPTRTAPSFMIKGIIASRMGDGENAFACFDHAALEYPRQAAALTDMLDSYLNRPYFAKTHEGLYFQQMYKATLEGYGFFSPNFQKALYYENSGLPDQAVREIYDHFFRRGNQAVHDYLLSDMEFCEEYLPGPFNRFFPEKGNLNLTVVGKQPLIGKRHLEITLENNSGISLQNVRTFLCYHLVGMYPEDYEVEELTSVNSILPGESFTWESRTHAIDEIVYTRAIILLDDKICWVDSPEYQKSGIYERAGRMTDPGKAGTPSRQPDSLPLVREVPLVQPED